MLISNGTVVQLVDVSLPFPKKFPYRLLTVSLLAWPLAPLKVFLKRRRKKHPKSNRFIGMVLYYMVWYTIGLDFSWGEMRTCCISPGGKLACVAFLPGRNSHALHLKFAWGETPMCRISPGEKLTCVAFLLGRNWY